VKEKYPKFERVKRREFRAESPGQLVSIADGLAFVPDFLPPKLHVDWDLANRLNLAVASLAKLDGQASLIQNKILITRPLLTREAIESARLEGTHTLVASVLLQEAGGNPSDPAEARNNREVLNYLTASDVGERWLREGRPLNLVAIRGLHDMLLSGTRGEGSQPGQFRQNQVVIGAQGDDTSAARFVPPPPEQVQPAMDDLMAFLVKGSPYPPLITAGIAHYQFETIHPFEDGNGRLGRLLIPLQLMSIGAISQPLVYLSPYFEGRRDEYLRLLKNVSTDGNWHAWLNFFLDAVHSETEDARARVERVLALHEEYRERAQTLRSKVPLTAVGLVMERVVVTVRQVARYVNCSYPTASSALTALGGLGIIEPVADTHPQQWIARELIESVYGV
jgi:Fic family protein